jgi:hypothetical protein
MNRLRSLVVRSFHRLTGGALVVAALLTGCDEAASDDAARTVVLETPEDFAAYDISEEDIEALMSVDLEASDDAGTEGTVCTKPLPNGCRMCCPTIPSCYMVCPP